MAVAYDTILKPPFSRHPLSLARKERHAYTSKLDPKPTFLSFNQPCTPLRLLDGLRFTLMHYYWPRFRLLNECLTLNLLISCTYHGLVATTFVVVPCPSVDRSSLRTFTRTTSLSHTDPASATLLLFSQDVMVKSGRVEAF